MIISVLNAKFLGITRRNQKNALKKNLAVLIFQFFELHIWNSTEILNLMQTPQWYLKILSSKIEITVSAEPTTVNDSAECHLQASWISQIFSAMILFVFVL